MMPNTPKTEPVRVVIPADRLATAIEKHFVNAAIRRLERIAREQEAKLSS